MFSGEILQLNQTKAIKLNGGELYLSCTTSDILTMRVIDKTSNLTYAANIIQVNIDQNALSHLISVNPSPEEVRDMFGLKVVKEEVNVEG